jgi:hypothetical protein
MLVVFGKVRMLLIAAGKKPTCTRWPALSITLTAVDRKGCGAGCHSELAWLPSRPAAVALEPGRPLQTLNGTPALSCRPRSTACLSVWHRPRPTWSAILLPPTAASATSCATARRFAPRASSTYCRRRPRQDRQTDRQTERRHGAARHVHPGRAAAAAPGRTDRKIDRWHCAPRASSTCCRSSQADRQTVGETYRKAGRQLGRRTERQADERQMDGRTDGRRASKQTDAREARGAADSRRRVTGGQPRLTQICDARQRQGEGC